MGRPLRPGEAPGPRAQTARQSLTAALRSDGPRSVAELSVAAHLSQKDVAWHLDRMREAGLPVRVLPADCPACGFVFEARKKARRPSRCPECRSGRLRAARYWIEG